MIGISRNDNTPYDDYPDDFETEAEIDFVCVKCEYTVTEEVVVTEQDLVHDEPCPKCKGALVGYFDIDDYLACKRSDEQLARAESRWD